MQKGLFFKIPNLETTEYDLKVGFRDLRLIFCGLWFPTTSDKRGLGFRDNQHA
jgi:hypothetical protein